MKPCTHHWTVTSECPKCLREALDSKPRPGSRMRKYMCKHGQIIRAARDDLQVKCEICESRFTLRDKT